MQSDNTPYQKNAYNDYLLDYMSELKCMRDTVLSLRASNERLEENLAKRLTEMKISLTETQHLQDKIDEFSKKNEQLIEKSICLEMERNTLSAELEQLRSQILDLRSSIKESTSEVNLLKKSNQELNCKISGYENSRSWRITKPLRSIAWFFRRMFGKNKT